MSPPRLRSNASRQVSAIAEITKPKRGSAFQETLRDDTGASPIRWRYVPHDQLHLALDPWSGEPAEQTGLVLIESVKRGRSRPYHKQKLAFVLANLRSFVLEAQAAGHPVLHLTTEGDFSEALSSLSHLGPLHVLRPAERELRLELSPMLEAGSLIEHPHPGWLTPREWFLDEVGAEPPFRMSPLYKRFRRESGALMDGDAPEGGKFSFDAENRQPWKGTPSAPAAPRFERTEVDLEVEALVEEIFAEHPGQVDLGALPTTREQALEALRLVDSVLGPFGPFEDAMSSKSRGLFHSRMASALNVHRVLPRELLELVLESEAPLNSREGFVRQLIWREYVHHVHEVTDGFRSLTLERAPTARRDAGWFGEGGASDTKDKELHPNRLRQLRELPRAYWEADSGLECLDATVRSVMEEGWTHHIPRLMVLGNIASLLDVEPRQLTDWFHAAFVDAYDWVVEPNVLGMGTFAVGEAMMTKPYVSGTPYIKKMSDHCEDCELDPKSTCPLSKLYWAFLARHQDAFEGNHRMSMPLRSMQKRSEEQRSADAAAFEEWSAKLA